MQIARFSLGQRNISTLWARLPPTPAPPHACLLHQCPNIIIQQKNTGLDASPLQTRHQEATTKRGYSAYQEALGRCCPFARRRAWRGAERSKEVRGPARVRCGGRRTPDSPIRPGGREERAGAEARRRCVGRGDDSGTSGSSGGGL